MRPRRIVVRTEDIKEVVLRLMEEYENVRISLAGHPLHRRLGLDRGLEAQMGRSLIHWREGLLYRF